MAQDALLAGRLEPANETYGIAKIVGIKLCDCVFNIDTSELAY